MAHPPQQARNKQVYAYLAAALPRVKAGSEQAVIGSLLLGFLVRDMFNLHVADQLDEHGQPVYTDIPVPEADIPDLSCRNLYLSGRHVHRVAAVCGLGHTRDRFSQYAGRRIGDREGCERGLKKNQWWLSPGSVVEAALVSLVDTPPEPSQAQRNMQANGAAHWANNHNYTWHAKKCKMHTLMRGVSAAGLEAGAVVPSEVVEARLYAQLVLWVEACSKRALLASLLLGLMVRDSFTRITVLADGQELLEELPAVDAPIPDFAERNLFLQLGRGLPPPGIHSQPSAAVEDVLIAYPDLHAELDEIPRYPQDCNTVDDVGQKLETSFANSLTELFKRRVGQAVALAGARVIAGSHEHQRRFGLPLGGRPAWTQRERSWVERSVRGKVVTWLEGQGGVVPTEAMRYEVASQRRLLGVGQGVVVNKAWRQMGVNRGSLLRHAVDTSRQLEAAHVSWQLDWAVWQVAVGQPNSRPYRPPSTFALTPSCSCKAHHIKLDTRAIYGLMRAAGMLPADITSLTRFRNGVAGPRDSEVVNRWIAFLPDPSSGVPNYLKTTPL
ncbi:hypothetical protein QJQ45_000494 [Haematococcus lacustris]|nr:hypothetical protein QJQ45_000494 [Haematococcus lacustris]